MKKLNWVYVDIVIIGVLVVIATIFVLKKVIQKTPIKRTLTPEQEAFILGLHANAQDHFRELIFQIESKTGWKVLIQSAYRTWAKQAQLKLEDSRNANPGFSFHNYGFTIDINLEKNGVRVRKADSNAVWEQTGAIQIAKALGFSWGGDFNNYHDPVHFDLKQPYTIQELHDKAVAQFGSNPANVQGNKVRL